MKHPQFSSIKMIKEFCAFAFLATFFNPTSVLAESGSLSLYATLPSAELDWSSPSKLSRSSIISTKLHDLTWDHIDKSGVGHVIVHYKCRKTNGLLKEVWTGMTGQNSGTEDRADILKNKIGLSVLFKDYRDGELQWQEGVSRNRIANHLGRLEGSHKTKPLFIRFKISPNDCDQIDDYHELMKSHSYDGITSRDIWSKKADHEILFFGFNFKEPHEAYLKRKKGDHRARLGSGCTAFAVSFLKLLGLHHEVFEDAWKRKLHISHKLLGGLDPVSGERRKVSLKDLFFAKSWNRPGDHTRLLEFYDPEMMWDFIDGVKNCRSAQEAVHTPKYLPKNCTPELWKWTWQEKKRIHSNAKQNVLANRILTKQKNVGSPKNPIIVTEKIPYTTFQEVQGIELSAEL